VSRPKRWLCSKKHPGSELIVHAPDAMKPPSAGAPPVASGRCAVGVGVPLTLPVTVKSTGRSRRANTSEPTATTTTVAMTTKRHSGIGDGGVRSAKRPYAAFSPASAAS
jgi:hypothetical protein